MSLDRKCAPILLGIATVVFTVILELIALAGFASHGILETANVLECILHLLLEKRRKRPVIKAEKAP